LKRSIHIPGAVLPTVMVVSALVCLSVLAVISLWEADFLYFSRRMHDAQSRAHIESGFTLYAAHTEDILSRLDDDGSLLLYDSMPDSRIAIDRRQMGLYEVVTISGRDGGGQISKLFGARVPDSLECLLYYPDRGSPITLTGRTNLKGRVKIPAVGISYGQTGSDFFRGDELPQSMIAASDGELPPPDSEALSVVEQMRRLATEDVVIESGRELHDTVVVARKARVSAGFRGSLQIFALDSVVVEQGVRLDYPSGLFSGEHVSVGDGSVVNGFVIVVPTGETDAMRANYVQARGATIRGLVYIKGLAQIQGIVSGAAFIDKAVYFSPRGYYENTLYDVTVLENAEMAWPLWFDAGAPRKEIKWLD